IHAPSVPGQVTITPHDTVAGNRHRQVIRPAGLCHRAHGFGFSDALGDIGIAHRGARRNLTESLPDAFLKGRPLEIQRQLEAALWRLDEADNPGDQLLGGSVAADELGPWELVLKIANELFRIITQKNRADTALALRNQDRAE